MRWVWLLGGGWRALLEDVAIGIGIGCRQWEGIGTWWM